MHGFINSTYTRMMANGDPTTLYLLNTALLLYIFQHDLWQRESSEKRRTMLQQIKILEEYELKF